MTAYRLYQLRPDGRIEAPADIIECDSDEEVIAQARAMINGRDIEIWDGARVVMRVPTNRSG